MTDKHGHTFDPVLSTFADALSTTPVSDQPLSQIVEGIRSPELATQTADIRKVFEAAGGVQAGNTAKRAIDAMKKALPAITLAGTFDQRANAGRREASGLVQVDIDGLDADALARAKALLQAHPSVAVCWTSPSGAGIKAAVFVGGEYLMVDKDRYRLAWLAVTAWLKSIGLVNDAAAKDPARLSFLSHDPEIYHNPAPAAFDVQRWSPATRAEAVSDRNLPAIPQRSPRLEDDEVLALIRSARNGDKFAKLWDGDCTGYDDDHSAADLALCGILAFYTGDDREQLDRLFRDSGLFREKWDERHYADGRTYGEQTITTAISGLREVYHRPELNRVENWGEPQDLHTRRERRPLDLTECLPQDLDWFRKYCSSVADSMQVPVEMVAMMALPVIAVAISGLVEAEVKPGYIERPPLWTLVTASSGSRKSAVIDEVARPLREWDERRYQELSAHIAIETERRERLKAQLEVLRREAAKGRDDHGEADRIARELHEV